MPTSVLLFPPTPAPVVTRAPVPARLANARALEVLVVRANAYAADARASATRKV